MELDMPEYKRIIMEKYMEGLTYKEKIAVIRVLSEIQNADHIVHDNEIVYMNEIISSFNLSINYKFDVDNMTILQALSIIRELTEVQKGKVAQMMGKMIVIDGDINYNEVKLYNAFCESCDIDKNFNVSDYPELTLSGPFINPEDLMNSL